MKTIGVIAVVGIALLAATGCGSSQSSADKAKGQACDAISDIQAQITTLKGLPLSTSSVDTAQTALKEINSDLETISKAVPDVTGDVKTQLQAANTAFEAQVKETAQSITSAQSLTAAATAVGTAAETLGASYQQTLGGVKC